MLVRKLGDVIVTMWIFYIHVWFNGDQQAAPTAGRMHYVCLPRQRLKEVDVTYFVALPPRSQMII